MKKTISNLVFIMIFTAMLIVPVLFMNTEKNQISKIDNKKLAEWPGFSLALRTQNEMEDYLNDRIGFRETAIETYIELNDRLFGVMVHPLFMYGRDGHIFYKDPAYIAAYQRLNTDPAYLDSFVSFLAETNAYLESKNIRFLYFLCPDKKTIYAEYFPAGIHVKEDNESIVEYLGQALSNTEVNAIIPTEELLAAKRERVVYNRLYDATHWNAFGAFIAQQLIDEKLQEWFPEVPPLREEDFDLRFEHRDTLDVAQFSIDETVPIYTPKYDPSQDATYVLEPYLTCETVNFYSHHVNPEAPDERILLVFTDSYFVNYTDFYTARFKEVYFVHRQNSDYLQYFVNLCFPDLVIFETAERSISGEMYAGSDFTDYYYEPVYPGEGEKKQPTDLGVTITSTYGVRKDGEILYLNPEEGDSIISVDGILTHDGSKTFDVYAHVAENYLETAYNALHQTSDSNERQSFSFNVQRRYMAQGPLTLIAVDRISGEQYLLAEFEVVYGK